MIDKIIPYLQVAFFSLGSLACLLHVIKSIVYIARGKQEPAPIILNSEIVADKGEVATVSSEDFEETTQKQDKVESAVAFSADKGQTLEDKYNALDSKTKEYYDQITEYASAVEGVKKFKNNRYEEYKIGAFRVVRLILKRGVIHCEFLMHNSDFKNYVAENKVNVKHSATVIKVTSPETIKAIKDSIDIVVGNIAIEKDFKKQLAKEKRKARREQLKG